MKGGLVYRPTNIIVLDAGENTFNGLYRELLNYSHPEPLRVSIGSLATSEVARIHVDNMAARFRVETQHIDDILAMDDRYNPHFPNGIIIMAPAGKDRKEALIKLMTELDPCPPILIGTPLVDSLAEAIELLAYASKNNTTLCVEAPRRYSLGVSAVRERLNELVPLSHISASINSAGNHLSLHNFMYGTVVQYADLICLLAREASEADEIPESLYCHHSRIYRHSISTSFGFPTGLIGSLASTSNHNQSDTDELLRVSGYRRWISVSDALQKYQFVGRAKDFNTPSYNDDSVDATGLRLLMTDFLERSTTTTIDHTGKRVTYDNTLRSYLPALWMVQAMQISMKTNQPVKFKEVNTRPIFEVLAQIKTGNATPTERLKKYVLAYAQAGYFDLAIEAFTEFIEIRDT